MNAAFENNQNREDLMRFDQLILLYFNISFLYIIDENQTKLTPSLTSSIMYEYFISNYQVISQILYDRLD